MSLAQRLKDLVSRPADTLAWRRRRFEETLRRRELLREARVHLAPRPLPAEGPAHVHLLLGHRTVAECIWALHSFLRHVDGGLPVLLHDDGTLSRTDVEALSEFFPGVRVLLRSETDSTVQQTLAAAGFDRLASLRREYVPALKLLDLQFYSRGKRVVYLDTDVLFFRRPDALVEAVQAGPEDSATRYNVDNDTWYTWSLDDLEAHTGIRPLPNINTGLFTTRVDDDLSWWPRYEDWLSIPAAPVSTWTRWHREQTLWATHFTAIGAEPLPEDQYDVHHRCGWKGMDREVALSKRDHGAPVVSQHYSGTWKYRQMFYHALRTRFFVEGGGSHEGGVSR